MSRPLDLSQIPLAYQTDDSFREQNILFQQKSRVEFQSFVLYQEIRCRLTDETHFVNSPCWIPRQLQNDKPIIREDVLRLNSRTAIEMGISPAAFHVFLPEHDSDFTKKYRWHFTVECRYGIRTCVRPSHLKIRLHLQRPIRYPLVLGRLDHHSVGYRKPKDPTTFEPKRADKGKVLDGYRRAGQKLKSAQTRLESGRGQTNDKEIVSYMTDYIELYKRYRVHPNAEDFQHLLDKWELKMDPPVPSAENSEVSTVPR